ncbi:OadG family transporter subunit [Vallitalea okinawensis]|uniref:OadG family transporter subunit n=1 Tax=Vallitalea okinawensis TaxID=2078660 RepID=UPI000CFC9EA3|nr:OadG family transporter subunit [Vallitalea okinawensis]
MVLNTALLSSIVEIGILGTIAGMLMVFLALILIALILAQFKHLGNLGKKNEAPPVVENKVVVEEERKVQSNQEDELELVAVITAAIAASMNTTSDKLVVKSLRRVSSNKSAWNATGRHENIHNNLY